jgi:hypothetical protein
MTPMRIFAQCSFVRILADFTDKKLIRQNWILQFLLDAIDETLNQSQKHKNSQFCAFSQQ